MFTKIALIALCGTTVFAQQRGGWQMGSGVGPGQGQNGDMNGWSGQGESQQPGFRAFGGNNQGSFPQFGGQNSGFRNGPGSGRDQQSGFRGQNPSGFRNGGQGFGNGGDNSIDGGFPGGSMGPHMGGGGYNPFGGSNGEEVFTGPGGIRNDGMRGFGGGMMGPMNQRRGGMMGGRHGGGHRRGGMGGKMLPFLKDVTPECKRQYFQMLKNATQNNETISQIEQDSQNWAAQCNATQAYNDFVQQAEKMMQEISQNVDTLIQSLSSAKQQLEQILNNKDVTPKELADQMKQFIQQNPQQFAALGFLAKLSAPRPTPPGMGSTAMPFPMPVGSTMSF